MNPIHFKKLFKAIEDGLNQGIYSGHLKMRTALMCMCVCTCVCLCVGVCSPGTSPGKAETGPDSETQACLPNVWYTVSSQYTRSLNKEMEWVSERNEFFGSPLLQYRGYCYSPQHSYLFLQRFTLTTVSKRSVLYMKQQLGLKTRRFSPSFSESKLSVCGAGDGSCLGFLSGSSTSVPWLPYFIALVWGFAELLPPDIQLLL